MPIMTGDWWAQDGEHDNEMPPESAKTSYLLNDTEGTHR